MVLAVASLPWQHDVFMTASVELQFYDFSCHPRGVLE